MPSSLYLKHSKTKINQNQKCETLFFSSLHPIKAFAFAFQEQVVFLGVSRRTPGTLRVIKCCKSKIEKHKNLRVSTLNWSFKTSGTSSMCECPHDDSATTRHIGAYKWIKIQAPPTYWMDVGCKPIYSLEVHRRTHPQTVRPQRYNRVTELGLRARFLGNI